MNTSLKNICGILFMAFMLNSCAFLDQPDVPMVEDKPFPQTYNNYSMGGGIAVMCLKGSYTGEHLYNTRLGLGSSWEKVPDRPDPAGKGKILTRYLWDDSEYSNFGGGKTTIEWGYTFTIYTTDYGIITKCLATEQLLRRY